MYVVAVFFVEFLTNYVISFTNIGYCDILGIDVVYVVKALLCILNNNLNDGIDSSIALLSDLTDNEKTTIIP